MIKFPLSKKEYEFELRYGTYTICFSGGFEIKDVDIMEIKLTDSNTGELITLNEKFLKPRNIIGSTRVVECFTFEIVSYSTLKLTVQNPESITMKKHYDMKISLLNTLRANKETPFDEIFVVIY